MPENTVSSARRKPLSAITAGIVAFAVVAAGSLVAAPSFAGAPAPSPTPIITNGGSLHPVAAAFSSDGSKAYVVDGNGFINAINPATDAVTEQIETTGPPPAPNGFLTGGALTPDGSWLYVPVYNNVGGPSLLKFSTATNELISRSYLGMSSPSSVVITPDGLTALVVGTTKDDPYDRAIFRVTLSTGAVTAIRLNVTSSSDPSTIVVSADSSTAYAATGATFIAKIDVASATLSAKIPVSGAAHGVALTADGSTAYVAANNGNIESIATASGTVTPVTNVAGVGFTGLALTPDDSRLVAVGNSTASSSGEAWVLSASTGSVGSSFIVGNSPWAVAISPDGAKAYVPNNYSGGTSVVPLVDTKPTLTGDVAPTKATVGSIYSAQFSATGYPTPTFSSTGDLPTGLVLDPATGLLSGKPTTLGQFVFQIVASNGVLPDATGVAHTVTVSGVLKSATPTISGTKKVGKKVKAKTATWGPAPVKLTYQWYRLSKGKWAKISKATKSTYKFVKADKKHKVRVVLTGKKTGYVTATKTSKAYTIK